ncbi:MAG: Gfo/Idh/MocA family oxidoreductase [Chloroflexi bacterium]|nr:Gfo/Idh/MocA family oxidoreductase [Chloroflexota bacterium]
MERKIRWGILSTAQIGRKAVVPALKDSAMAEVVAVASRSLEEASTFAESFYIPRAYGSYKALLADQEIDAVYIPLPNHLHKLWTIRVAEAGKHILCEKPLALDVVECQEMIAAARANGVQLMEAFMYRYHPRILAAHQMVLDGVIGDLKTIETAFTYRMEDTTNIRFQPEMGGGALMDVGCYCVNISRLMAGREPITVQARLYRASTGVDNQLVGLLNFGDGLLAHFDCAMNQESRQRCLLAGTYGYLEIPNSFNIGVEDAPLIEQLGAGNRNVYTFAGANIYTLMAEDFMRSIAGGSPTFPIEDALGNMRSIQALFESTRQNGQPVVL